MQTPSEREIFYHELIVSGTRADCIGTHSYQTRLYPTSQITIGCTSQYLKVFIINQQTDYQVTVVD